MEERYKYLTREDAEEIICDSERIFALACLESGCIVYYQIDLGGNIIDFLVINPRNKKSPGKLVEVTFAPRSDMALLTVCRKINGRLVEVPNITRERKMKQIESMKNSGLPWTILFGEEILRLK